MVERARILEPRKIAGFFSEMHGPNHAAHDLGVARARQIAHEVNFLRTQWFAQHLGDLVRDLSRELRWRFVAGHQHREQHRNFALGRMRYADRGRFLDTWKLRGSGFDFGRAETFARDLERIVRTAEQKPMAAGVAQRPVAMHPDSFEAAPVRIEIAPRILPEPLGHARPRVQRRKFADRIDYRLAVVIERHHFYPGYGGVEPAWLDRTKHRASEESARDLGTARIINDGAAPLADIFEQPHVRLGSPYFASRAKDAQ